MSETHRTVQHQRNRTLNMIQMPTMMTIPLLTSKMFGMRIAWRRRTAVKLRNHGKCWWRHRPHSAVMYRFGQRRSVRWQPQHSMELAQPVVYRGQADKCPHSHQACSPARDSAVVTMDKVSSSSSFNSTLKSLRLQCCFSFNRCPICWFRFVCNNKSLVPIFFLFISNLLFNFFLQNNVESNNWVEQETENT